ncbi:MAG: tyrosine-type recombinase/integrase [Alphaproteobacteria bacterium]
MGAKTEVPGKLTKRVVDGAAPDPDGGNRIYWDSDVKGFGLRVTAAGVKAYVLSYRFDGRKRLLTIGKHGSPWACEEARIKATSLLRDITQGIDPLEAKAEVKTALTVAALATLYLTEGPVDSPNKKPRTWEAYASSLNRHILPMIGRKLVKSVTQTDIAKLQADISTGKTAVDVKTGKYGRAIVTGGKVAAARSIAALSTMFEFAVNRKLVPSNPARGVKLLKSEHRERFLSEHEVAALADTLVVMEEECAINPAMASAIRLLLLTGCRKGEVLTLKWAYIDFDRGCLRLPESKTGAKVVPLAAAALEILAGLPRDSEWVFPAAKGDGHVVGLQKAWEKLRDRAGLPGLRLHDLRHSFASFAVADGATLFMVGKVLGHKQTSTTEIYAHLRDDPLKAVADRTGARIANAMKVGTDRNRPKADVVPLPTNRKR